MGCKPRGAYRLALPFLCLHLGGDEAGKMNKVRALTPRQESIKDLREQGFTYAEIAREIGGDEHNIRKTCLAFNWNYEAFGTSRVEMDREAQMEFVQKICVERGFEYCGGYECNLSIVKLRCKSCGQTIQKVWHDFQQSKGSQGTYCEICRAAQKAADKKREQLKKADKAIRITQRRFEREASISFKQPRFMVCCVCGAMYSSIGNGKYCSGKCRRKAHEKTKEIRRRQRIESKLIDKDITVNRLYVRDKGICHLCGKPCDPDDYTVIDNAFIVGKLYPSIDHLKPIAGGGEHSWANVKLAHMICNSMKGAKDEADGAAAEA